ncbi:zinc finger protein 1 [Pochonia chlamydosporia 170]|uniref:Zinc finger protein 1 n=1 Tax=Pochonia chlamydosporia 170 TaxID=1380566 RepID=A0A219AR16_METCM|nr:zinc finger protein 1 [Pochonia chlamydosporia 170]OWT42615.1 zinc finger protein 1 [Pochonia chlamydosporia 170]
MFNVWADLTSIQRIVDAASITLRPPTCIRGTNKENLMRSRDGFVPWNLGSRGELGDVTVGLLKESPTFFFIQEKGPIDRCCVVLCQSAIFLVAGGSGFNFQSRGVSIPAQFIQLLHPQSRLNSSSGSSLPCVRRIQGRIAFEAGRAGRCICTLCLIDQHQHRTTIGSRSLGPHPQSRMKRNTHNRSTRDRSSSSSAETDETEPSSSLAVIPAAGKPQPTTRRGHFKSRLGCFNCKRRRVKCNELRPSCSPCRRLGLFCDYPSAFSAAGPVRANPSALSLQDLQFYHRFLTTAFPTLPLRADKVWAKCASECLAHAVLGLGASHLTQHGEVDYTSQALNHRVTAIKLVNEQFINPPKDADTADALFAAIICLATQTSLLPDGMVEYLTITRGGALIWAFVIPGHKESLFSSFTNESHDEALSQVVSEEPKDFEIPDEFLASVMRVNNYRGTARLIPSRYVATVYHGTTQLANSVRSAWKAHADLWRAHCYFDNDTFSAFVHQENYPAQLLIVHMFLLDYVLGPFCTSSKEEFKFPARKQVIISWARNLLKRLPPEFKIYGNWIEKYCYTLESSNGRSLLTP